MNDTFLKYAAAHDTYVTLSTIRVRLKNGLKRFGKKTCHKCLVVFEDTDFKLLHYQYLSVFWPFLLKFVTGS